ncbi:MAG: hypothetical protein QOH24_566 [Verrucomicrobiota bacterium]|jgi:hypothetical protein
MNHIHHYSQKRVIRSPVDNASPARTNASPARTEGPREIIQDDREIPRFARDDAAHLYSRKTNSEQL